MPRDHHDPLPIDVAGVSTILCDADGNLFPSEEPAFDASAEVTNRFLTRLGSSRRYTAGELRRMALGRNFRSLAMDLAHGVGATVSTEDLQIWVDEEAAVVTRHLAAVLPFDDEVFTVLTELAVTYRLAVVSSSALARLGACFTATGLDDLFPVVARFSAQDSLPAPTSKPDPAVYRHALTRLGLAPENAVAVEDAVAGVASAVGAGISTVGNLAYVPASERARREEELYAAGASVVVDTWQELRNLLRPAMDGAPR